jgi:RNA polymerase sigma-70 factor (ECF subfamily)
MEPEELLPSEAFVHIVRQHRRAVFSLAYSKVRNVQDAEDITQEVFAEAFANIKRILKHQYVLGWLLKAADFRCKDHIRRTVRRNRREGVYATSMTAMAAEKQQQGRDDELLDVIATLPEKYRTILMLKHFAMLSYDDISQVTGLSKTTIDGRLRSAKKELKARLEKSRRS